MLMEDGFSYTKSELEEEAALKASASASSEGSTSDELTDSDIENNAVRARRAARAIENRMKYFRKHVQFLKVENGKIADPMKNNYSWKAEPSTTLAGRGSRGSQHSLSLQHVRKKGSTSSRSDGARSITLSSSRISTDNVPGTLDQLVKKKETEDSDKKRAMFHNIRLKKTLMLEKLGEYLTMLLKKQQTRLFEEYARTSKKFRYAGPTRDGPLFCLREKYRRERKAWRVKYAKKYGLLCSKVRLEKRLMRKAKRLLRRERILNALRDKSRSKLLVLLEMQYEFKKLVQRLKLNKEIQEKIKRQDKLGKSNESCRARKKMKYGNESQRGSVVKRVLSKNQTGSKQTINKGEPINAESLETIQSPRNVIGKIDSETQKSAHVKTITSRISDVSILPPLPSVPATSQTSVVKLSCLKQSASQSKSKSLRSVQTSTRYFHCPLLVQDKKTCSVPSGSYPWPEAKESASTSKILPMTHEQLLGAAAKGEHRFELRAGRSSRIYNYPFQLKRQDQNIETLLSFRRKQQREHVESVDALSFSNQGSSQMKQRKKRSSVKDRAKGTLVKHVQPPNWPVRTILPITELPGGYVRQSAIDILPRNKFSKSDGRGILDRKAIDIFALHYRRAMHDQLYQVFGSGRTESFYNKVLCDVKKMSDFILDHMHLLPPRDLNYILGKLMDMKDDPRFEVFKNSIDNVNNDLNYQQNDPNKRFEVKFRANAITEFANESYKEFEKRLIQRRKDFRAHKSPKRIGRDTTSSVVVDKNTSRKKRRRMLVDKLLLQRTTQFDNPVRVTTKLGGRFMLQGWRHITHEEYASIGRKIQVYKSGWRKDGMENYEVMAPIQGSEDLKYFLILNRLDLTPRRFKFPGYEFDAHILPKFMYSSNFYRFNLLKRGERKTDKGKPKLSFQTEIMGTQKLQRVIVGDELNQGEFTVPHLRHRIFRTPEYLVHQNNPSDKHTPMIFSLRNEFEQYDENDPHIMKIQLQETSTLDLFELKSTVAVRGSDNAINYLKERRMKGNYKKMFHRMFEQETQTLLVNSIDRSTQLYAPNRDSKRTNVYETDIVKANIPPPLPKVKTLRKPGFQEDESSESSDEGSLSSVESLPDETSKILTNSAFASSAKLTLRIMDSQLYANKQLIFRQGLKMDPLDPKAEITYSHERLFAFIDHRLALSEYVVSSIDWSSLNPNLLAVGYARHPLYPEQDKGLVCIWNIKMITRYERKFEFKNGVTYLQFCKPFPRLLNVALFDGSVVILDLGAKRNAVVTAKPSSVFSNYKPVWQFSWIEMGNESYLPLTCGDNGFVHQLRPDGTFQHSKFLSLGHREGNVKGIKISSSMGLKPRIRARPGITCMAKHPTDPVTYLVGTTDGCVHICSIHFRNQHLDVFSAHTGAVKGIQFHPHCEQVFLTYGEDFYVRVWLYGTFEPALELMADNYFVRSARWSPTNAEILVSVSNKFVDVWDVRRKTDSPVHRFKNPRDVENTALEFDETGRNIVIGTISGDVYVYTLKNMPFPHHFKGEAIANSMEKILKAKKKFVRDIMKLGYPFGAHTEPLYENGP